MSLQTKRLSLTINGTEIGPFDIPVDMMMIDFLHEYANLTGTRYGCGIGLCHACTVILDIPTGQSLEMRSCITRANYFSGKTIRTVEGHAERDADGSVQELCALQKKFLEHYAFQCSYCTPGMLNAAVVLLERLAREPVPVEQLDQVIVDAMDAHICRCTGYVRYYQAVKEVVLSSPGLTTVPVPK